jgi:hypothetical protein
MANNPILDELREAREYLLAESGGTVSGLLNRLRADQAASNRPVYNPSDNNAMHRSGEAVSSEVEDLSSPPGDR